MDALTKLCSAVFSLLFLHRIQSLRRSIRQSFRQRRNSTQSNDRRKIAHSLNLEADSMSYKKQSSRSVRPRASSEPTSPVLTAAPSSQENDSKVISKNTMYLDLCGIVVEHEDKIATSVHLWF